jgi:hypothetical protein
MALLRATATELARRGLHALGRWAKCQRFAKVCPLGRRWSIGVHEPATAPRPPSCWAAWQAQRPRWVVGLGVLAVVVAGVGFAPSLARPLGQVAGPVGAPAGGESIARPPGYRALDGSGLGYARRGGASVRVAPRGDAELISQLFYDTPLPLLGVVDEGGQPGWYEVELWGVLRGWIRAAEVALEAEPEPTPPPWERQQPPPTPTPRAATAMPLQTTGRTVHEARWRAGPSVDAPVLAELPTGQVGAVTAWTTDGDGDAWFALRLGEATGWVYGANLTLDRPAGTASGVAAGRLAGKGMWIPRAFGPLANPRYLVRAARQLGLTHLYIDVASSDAGFHGRSVLDALLPEAHAAGLRVVGWLWPTLADPVADVALSVEVARYTTPSGDQLDGLAPNAEERMALGQVQAYIQVLRTLLGPDYLLVGTVFPPEHPFAQRYPQHVVLAGWVDVLAPMTYWSEQRRTFPGDEVARYIQRAIRQLRADVGDPTYPVAPIGQMYDTFGRNGIGPYSPGSAEITAALQASRAAGALGMSFFQWGTATPAEWRALRDFAW